MVNELCITLLGSPVITLGGEPVKGFISSKSQALVYYLAATGQIHSRDVLAGLLWSEVPDSTAKRNLRDVLSNLRQLIDPYLLITRQTVSLNQEAHFAVDSRIFTEKLSHPQPGKPSDSDPNVEELASISEAIALYKGEFLAGFYISSAPLFEEWALGERIRLQRELERGLERLVTGHLARREYKTAIRYAQRWSSINPVHEPAHRYLMQLHTRDGNRSAALSQYHECARILKEELGVDPATETTALFERILSGELTAGSPDQGELVIRGYELRELIGEGSFGAVYRAYQPLTKREVAVKIILPRYANQPDFIRRFESEAQLVARLEHPHIVPLFDYWREPDRAYLVMRWLRGGSLRSSLAAGAWDAEAVKELVNQIATALAVAHRKSVVHRDIKPANILLDEEGNAFLSDFGIAKDLSVKPELADPDANTSSPAYISPEQIIGEAVTPLTDVYSLGVVLYEMLAGKHPFPDESFESLRKKHLSEPLPSILVTRPDLPVAVDEVIQKCTAKNPVDRFPNILSLCEAFRLAISAESLAKLPLVDVQPVEPINPYKGLRPFYETDCEDFFGRETLTEQLLLRLGEFETMSSFLAVIGPSGCGKSSVVRAGLIPALRQGALPGSENWFIVQMLPGEHPFEKLETALLGIVVNPPDSPLEQLQEDEYGLLRTLNEGIPGNNTKVLLVIDQFEEVFYQVEQESERTNFLECLFHAVTDPHSPLILVITLRADFYDRPLSYPNFGDLVRTSMETVMPLSAEELAQAIALPSERVGVRLEPELEAKIVSDVIDQPGSLPLLQYALTELFDNREDNTLTTQAYQAVGGVMEALVHRADELFNQLDTNGQEAVRQLFLRLVRLSEVTESTRRRVLRSELEGIGLGTAEMPDTSYDAKKPSFPINSAEVMNDVIELYGRYRLLTFDRDPSTRAPTIEVAHEALIKKWDRLQEWLDTSREDIRIHRNLNRSTNEWLDADCDPSFLLRGSRLDLIEVWANKTDLALTSSEGDYLKSSLVERRKRQADERARQDREITLEKRSRNFLRALVVVLALATVIALVLTSFAFNRSQIAQENAATAAVAQGQALNQAATATFAQGVAQLQAGLAAQSAEGAREQKALAEAEADSRATQQSIAEGQANLATSRELAASALNNLSIDPERSILLAITALDTAQTLEAENALHRAIHTSRVRLTLSGHRGPVHFVDLSPDEKLIATASQDGTAKLWDAFTGREVLTLVGHDDEVIGIDFSPSGKRIATSSYDGTAKVWDTSTGQETMTLTGHKGPLVTVYFSSDGTRLVTNGLYDGMVIMWDANSGEALHAFNAHQEPMWHVIYSPDESRLATASVDGTAKVWDANSGEQLLTLPGQAGLVSRVSFSPDGSQLATGHENGTAKLWDAISGEEILTFEGHTTLVLWVSFSPDGKRLATASVDGTAKIWDVLSGEELFTLAGHSAIVMGTVFTQDGIHLLTGSFDGTAKLWDLSPKGELFTLSEHRDQVYSLDFNMDGSRLASGSFDGTVRIWDVASGQEEIRLGKLGDSAKIRGVVFSPDGELLAGSSAYGTITVWNVASGEEITTLSGHAPGQTGETKYNGIVGVAFSPDGKLLATASDDLTAKIWDISSGKELFTLSGHDHAPVSIPPFDGVIQVGFSPDGKRLVTAGGDGTVKVWDTSQYTELFTLEAHPGSAVIDVTFSPDGAQLLTGSFDGPAKLWDVATGKELLTLSGHTGGVYGVAFTPDGTRLVTGSEDATTKVWDAETGQILLTLTGHTLGILDIAISPDGKYLATASQDGSIRFYVLPVEELITLAQSRLTRSLTVEECQQFLHVDECPIR
jgi:WD40 repeat protein/serine/threonine protein kinase